MDFVPWLVPKSCLLPCTAPLFTVLPADSEVLYTTAKPFG